MKLLLGTAAISIALLSFAGSDNASAQQQESRAFSGATYQDTIPKRDSTGKKDRNKKDKKERRDTMNIVKL